jgi:hypothetical protein
LSTDTGPRASAAAADTGAAIARKHLDYLTDLLTIVRILKGPTDELLSSFWSAYVREILSGMHRHLGAQATSAVLLDIARQTEEEIQRQRAGGSDAH